MALFNRIKKDKESNEQQITIEETSSMPKAKYGWRFRHAITIFLIFVLVVGVILGGSIGGIKLVDATIYSDFYKNSTAMFNIPGLNDGAVPQGLDYTGTTGTYQNEYIMTAYFENNQASKVYVIRDNVVLSAISLYNEDGSVNKSHVGGIAHLSTKYFYITDSSRNGLQVYKYDDIVNNKDGKATAVGFIKTYNSPAYVQVVNYMLFVGDFYKEGSTYNTPSTEHLIARDGSTNTALIRVYTLSVSSTETFGVTGLKCVISTQDLVQGICFDGSSSTPTITITDGKVTAATGYVFLSRSWGISTSKIEKYSLNYSKTSDSEQETLNKKYDNKMKFSMAVATSDTETTTVPILYLDTYNDCKITTKCFDAPPMAEGIVYVNKSTDNRKIVILNESATNKYIFGKFTGANVAYGYNVA